MFLTNHGIMATPTEMPPGIINWILEIPSAVVYLFFLLKSWVLSQIRQRRNATQNYTAIAAATPIMELPDSIMCDILSRLPLNSIFICRRVCKVWRNLLLDPSFANLHLSRSPISLFFYCDGYNTNSRSRFKRSPLSLFLNRNNWYPKTCVDWIYGYKTSTPCHFEIFEINDPPLVPRCKTTMKFRTAIHFPPYTRSQVVASCNGSFLVLNYGWSYDDEIVVVCNPLREQHLVLPKPPETAFQGIVARFGLGHSPSTHQYKVLRLSLRRCLDRYRLTDGHIYTIGIDDEWRCIGEIGQTDVDYVSRLVFLNGALHWIAGTKDSLIIYYFDIEKEQFGSFPLPCELRVPYIFFGVVDNMMYVGTKSLDDYTFWVLKDYGVFGSWTLEWIIKVQALGPKFAGAAEPLKMLKDGSLLMMFTDYFVQFHDIKTALALFNPHTKLLKEVKYYGSVLPLGHLCANIPSFFSPMDALE